MKEGSFLVDVWCAWLVIHPLSTDVMILKVCQESKLSRIYDCEDYDVF